MNFHDEKTESISSSVTADAQQLRQDIEKNAAILAHYEYALHSRRHRRLSSSAQRTWIQNVLAFIANAPAYVLRSTRNRLRRLLGKALSMWRNTLQYMPRLLVGDHINFEDALGRRMRLPLRHFNNERILRQYIKYIFEGVPGEYQVSRNRFVLDFKDGRGGTKRYTEGCQLSTGDQVSMSVLSIVPAEPERVSRQWRCPGCGALVRKTPRTSNFNCHQCEKAYSIERTHPRRHVRPSDGDRANESMIAQKSVVPKTPEVIKNTLHNGESVLEDVLQASGLKNTNVGLGHVKSVVVVETQEPSKVLDAMEELLHQINGLSGNSYDQNKELSLQRLSNILALLRTETERGDEVNMFDFEKEHTDFMSIAREVLSSLQGRLDACRDGCGLTYKSVDYFEKLAKWTKQRFPEAVISRSPDCWTTSLINPQSRPDSETSAVGVASRGALLMVNTLAGMFFCLRVSPAFTIRDLKMAIYDRTGIPLSQQYLVSQGKKMEEHRTVEQCDLTGAPRWYVHTLIPIWKARERDPLRET